ncbi:MAG: mannose-1-phosphate guanylyltransferase [Treponema sp.]|nr:mannose-1-phosphate guanylyltransferase [Treponema sp.]
MKTTALIMAGGRGERFWPKSRKNLPKQFLSLTNDSRTMIQLTVDRIKPLVDIKDVYIATNKNYLPLVKEQLPDIPSENIICEPIGRNTAPCIGLGAAHIAKNNGDALMMVLASDSLIKNDELFVDTLRQALDIAQKDKNIVTMGITPNYPETGYGYIKFDAQKKNGEAFKVERFVEKPDLEKAKEYLADGSYLWNSGMFVWKASTVLGSIQEFMPDLYAGLQKIQAAVGTADCQNVLESVFPTLPSESIDYGVMEKARDIYTLPGDFGWDDVGSWLAVGRIRTLDETNSAISGNVVAINCEHNIIQGGKKLIAAVGLKDMVVVDTDDAILICSKESAGDIKKVLQSLRDQKREEYL